MIQKITIYIFLLLASSSFGQQNIRFSDSLIVSVLTCGTGDELYSQFGHSAFRIQDHINHIDIVYNYGVFDFSKPNFYTNFVKGKLYYKLGYNSYYNFIRQYEYENRSVFEQTLNLTSDQREKLVAFLQNNAKPENATYQYTFFYNNCATKIRDVLETVFPEQITFHNFLKTNYTQRDLINNNVPHNSWSNVGINLALGSVIDKKATPRDYQFLPEYIAKSFEHASINKKSLVQKEQLLLAKKEVAAQFSIGSPYVIFTLIGMLILAITYFDAKKEKRSGYLDFILHFITGFLGVAVLLLWFATYHAETKNNLNILWAVAPNFVIAFMMLKKKLAKWLLHYYTFLLVLLVILIVVWVLKIEVFAYAMIPFFIALFVRCLYVHKHLRTQHKG